MAIVNKATIKTYFEQGDIPTQGQYFNFIDSTFNLADDEVQNVKGTLSASSADFGNIRISKAYFPGVGVGTAVVGKTFTIGKTIEVMGSAMINASGSDPGNLTVAGELSTNTLSITGGTVSASNSIITKHLSASGNISGSKIQSHQNIIHYKGIEGGMSIEKGFVVGPALVVSGSISSSATITVNDLVISNDITSSGNISSSGTITGNALNIYGSTATVYGSDSRIMRLRAGTDGGLDDETPSLQTNAKNLAIIVDTGNAYDDNATTFSIRKHNVFSAGASTIFEMDGTGNITGSGAISSSGAISTDGNLSSSAQVTCEHLFSSDDAEITDALTVGGNINANGNIVGDGSTAISSMASLGIGSVTATGTIQAEQLTSTDDISAAGNITATGHFIGDNIGGYTADFIPVLPTDFVNRLGGNEAISTVLNGGNKISAPDTINASFFASYFLPIGISLNSFEAYGDNGECKILVYKNSIDAGGNGTAVVSNGSYSTSGTNNAFSATITNNSTDLLYLTVVLQFSGTSGEFYGGKLRYA